MFQQQPDRLTIDGVVQILGKSTFQGQSFVLQVLSITNNYLGHYYTELSDGYCKVKCEFGLQVKAMAQAQLILCNSILNFTTGDFEILDQDKNNLMLLLNKCAVVKRQMSKTIGSPMPYKLYKQKNSQNPEGQNLIQQGPRIYTLRQVINNQRMKNCSIRAKVQKLPKSTSLGMLIFHIKDDQGTQIQAVCFEQIAEQFFRHLQEGQEYIFSNFQVQKNRKTNEDELKFKSCDSLQKIGGNNKTKVKQQSRLSDKNEISFKKAQKDKNTTNNNNIEVKVQLADQPAGGEQRNLTKKQIVQLIHSNEHKDKFFAVVGKVIYLNQKAKYRKINVQDANKQTIDIMLWQQVIQPVIMHKTYCFSNLRLKPKLDVAELRYIELHSSKKTLISTVQPSEFQLMGLNTNNEREVRKPYHNYYSSKWQQEPLRPQRTKKLPEALKLHTLSQIIQLSEVQPTSQLPPVYPYTQCCIKIRTDALRFRDQGDALNFFTFYCLPCSKTTSVNLGDNETLSCNRCKKNDIQVKWNLRVRVMDSHNELPCSLQSQTTQRFLNINPKDGYLLYSKNKQQFQILLNCANFEYRVCKFQMKTQGVNKYFNILQIYAKDSQLILNIQRLKLEHKMQEFGAFMKGRM